MSRKKSPRINLKPANNQHYIMGRNTLEEVLKHCPEKLLKVFTVPDKIQSSTTPNRKDTLLTQLSKYDIPIEFVPKKQLDQWLDSTSHQSFLGIVKSNTLDFNTFLAQEESKDSSCLLFLDSIEDPQNLGALLRCAECFGVSAVVWSKNRSTGLSPVATKASVGASELIPHFSVSNLHQALLKSKKMGYQAVGADNIPQSQDLNEFAFPSRSIIVMGSEGKGLQAILKKELDHVVRISLKGKLSSLNVSHACSVFLYSWSKKNT